MKCQYHSQADQACVILFKPGLPLIAELSLDLKGLPWLYLNKGFIHSFICKGLGNPFILLLSHILPISPLINGEFLFPYISLIWTPKISPLFNGEVSLQYRVQWVSRRWSTAKCSFSIYKVLWLSRRCSTMKCSFGIRCNDYLAVDQRRSVPSI
jgi:hypothetical protein